MKFAALVSGGKDSVFNILECVAHGHELVAIINLTPPVDQHNCAVEINSYMYQSVGNEAVTLLSKCLDVPIFQNSINRKSVCQDIFYKKCLGDEVEDLYDITDTMIKQIPGIEALASGAILSDYQRNRVENVAQRLRLRSLAFLWRRRQDELLDDMIAASIDAVLIKIASYGLDIEKDLGASIADRADHFKRLSKPPYLLNVCGEGGEYETFTLNCPLFSKEIYLNSKPKRVILSSDPCAPVAYLQLNDITLKPKSPGDILTKPSELLAIRSASGRAPFISPIDRLHNLQSQVCNEIQEDRSLCVSGCCSNLRPSSYSNDLPDGFSQLGHGLFWISRNCVGSAGNQDTEFNAVRSATKNAFMELKSLLDRTSIPTNHVVQILALINRPLDPDLFSAFNQVYSAIYRDLGSTCEMIEFVGDLQFEPAAGYLPSRVCLGVRNLSQILKLSTPDPTSEPVLVSLSVIVWSSQSRDPFEPNSVRGLLVRSISHWAPSNIGPYSQALCVTRQSMDDDASDMVSSSNWTFYSGQIGLIPELSILPKSVPDLDTQATSLELESWLVLRHCHRVIKVMSPHIWTDLVVGFCYATSRQALLEAQSHFHLAVCSEWFNHSGSCVCPSRMVWSLVQDLPMHASIEWQFVTQTEPDQPELVRNWIPGSTRDVSIWFVKSVDQCDCLDQFQGMLIPVRGFLDPTVESVGVIL